MPPNIPPPPAPPVLFTNMAHLPTANPASKSPVKPPIQKLTAKEKKALDDAFTARETRHRSAMTMDSWELLAMHSLASDESIPRVRLRMMRAMMGLPATTEGVGKGSNGGTAAGAGSASGSGRAGAAGVGVGSAVKEGRKRLTH